MGITHVQKTILNGFLDMCDTELLPIAIDKSSLSNIGLITTHLFWEILQPDCINVKGFQMASSGKSRR